MLRVGAALVAGVVGVAASVLGAASPAVARAPGAPVVGGEGEKPSTPVVTPEAAAGSVAVTVTQSGTTAGGGSFSRGAVVRSVPPVCWYGRGMSGYAYYEYWKLGGPARESKTLDDFAAQGLLHQGWESHATDSTGFWYEPSCRFDAPAGTLTDYLASHPAVFVPAGEPAPPQDAEVDPEVLAQIAAESMDLPQGTIRWNPSLTGSGATIVNAPTWVWVEGAATTVSVTASIPSGTWARVDAALSGLEVRAPGSDGASCPDTGTPWGAGTASTCTLTFFRSTANQPVKGGQSLPTATLTAEARWTASWVSSVNPGTATALPAQTIATSAEVPVAEVQSVVTSGRG